MFAKDESEQFDAVNNSHRNRWNGKTRSKMGFYGGYHYIVERNGAVQQFRGDNETGAHNNKQWMNFKAIGITFAGNMSRQNLTEAQIKSGVELIRQLQESHNIPDTNVTPHRLYKATQCPGNNIPDKAWPWLQEQYGGSKEKWRMEAEKWASKYVKDVDSFVRDFDIHKIIELIRRSNK